jgi:glycosyltransferase involved in cell wall biosynthesis
MLFSILTTSYNQSKTIGDTIESCLNQTFDDYEILISDDGSKDNSEEIILSFKDSRIRYYKQEKNLKEYRNRNFLVENAKGDYIIFIDGEDIIYPHCLEVMAYYISHFPESAMIVTREWDPRIIYPVLLNSRELYAFDFLDVGLFGGNFTNMLFKREEILRAGMFPTNVRSGDTYMQYKLALTNNAVLIADGLAWWRRSSGNVTEKLDVHYSAKDYSHLANTNNYKLDFLNDPSCPLSADENELAKKNIYGSSLRIIFRWLAKLQFSKIHSFYSVSKIPSKYWGQVFVKAKRDYFKNHTGDNPMKTSYTNNQILHKQPL